MDNPAPDEEPITKLYQEMYGRMVAYASSVLRNRNLAEEAVQDTFCIFCAKAHDTLQHEKPPGWLMRTLQNVMRNMQRHRATMSRLIMQSLQTENLEELLVYDEQDVDLLYGDLAARADFQLLKRVYWTAAPCWRPQRSAALPWRRAKSESSGFEPI